MIHSNEFMRGVKFAVKHIADQLELDEKQQSYRERGEYWVTPEWLGHYVVLDGECGCFLDLRTYDEYPMEVKPCNSWKDATYRRAWHCQWYGITIEQLAAMEVAELEARSVSDREARKRRVERLKAELEAELKDLGVQITLPEL